MSNQNSYIQYFSVPSLPCLRSYLVLHVQLTTWSRLTTPLAKVKGRVTNRSHLSEKVFRWLTVLLTGSLIKDISPYHPSAIFKSFFSRISIINRFHPEIIFESWSCPVKKPVVHILTHWLPLRYVFVRLLYLK